MTTRRQFSKRVVIAAAVGITPSTPGVVSGNNASPGKDVFTHIVGERGQFDLTYYRQLLGAANTFKEGDHTVGVAAEGPQHRNLSRHLLANTRIRDIDRRPPFQDELYAFITKSHSAVDRPIGQQTLGELKQFLLTRAEPEIKSIMPSLSSDVIACVVKLMSNAELTQVGSSIFNPLPGSNVGARGYLGARVQPNSPTDHPDDIRWQVFGCQQKLDTWWNFLWCSTTDRCSLRD